VVICLEQGADLHMAQLMPLPLTVSCFSKIQIGFTFLVPAHLGSPGQRAVKRLCVCVCVLGNYDHEGLQKLDRLQNNTKLAGMTCHLINNAVMKQNCIEVLNQYAQPLD